MEVLRTPDAAFDGLVDWPYPPAYYTSTLFGADVRIAFYDLCGGRHADAAETVSALAAPATPASPRWYSMGHVAQQMHNNVLALQVVSTPT